MRRPQRDAATSKTDRATVPPAGRRPVGRLDHRRAAVNHVAGAIDCTLKRAVGRGASTILVGRAVDNAVRGTGGPVTSFGDAICMVEPALFKSGMRRLASGVSLVTTVLDGQRHGLVATSVCSVSVEPPSLLVCVNRASRSHDAIRAAGVLCVSVLGADGEAVARRFSSPEQRDTRFAVGEWATLSTGAPALADALASFDCRITQTVLADTHTIFIAVVVAAKLGHMGKGALVYLDGQYNTLAPGSLAESVIVP